MSETVPEDGGYLGGPTLHQNCCLTHETGLLDRLRAAHPCWRQFQRAEDECRRRTSRPPFALGWCPCVLARGGWDRYGSRACIPHNEAENSTT